MNNNITYPNKDALANVFDPDKLCSWSLARSCGCHWQQFIVYHAFLKIFSDFVGRSLAWDYLLVLFFEPVTNYLFRARLKTIKLKKQKQTKHNTRCHGNIDKQSERENYNHRKGTMVERINPITTKKKQKLSSKY